MENSDLTEARYHSDSWWTLRHENPCAVIFQMERYWMVRDIGGNNQIVYVEPDTYVQRVVFTDPLFGLATSVENQESSYTDNSRFTPADVCLAPGSKP